MSRFQPTFDSMEGLKTAYRNYILSNKQPKEMYLSPKELSIIEREARGTILHRFFLKGYWDGIKLIEI